MMANKLDYVVEKEIGSFPRVFNEDGECRIYLDISASMQEAKETGWFRSNPGMMPWRAMNLLYRESLDSGNKAFLRWYEDNYLGSKEPKRIDPIPEFHYRQYRKGSTGGLELDVDATIKMAHTQNWFKHHDMPEGVVREQLYGVSQDADSRGYLGRLKQKLEYRMQQDREKREQRRAEQKMLEEAKKAALKQAKKEEKVKSAAAKKAEGGEKKKKDAESAPMLLPSGAPA